jgi:outer membrane protein OmpA-like peptidoglycan-associated protein
MDEVTSKGIWTAGLVALGALAAFCIWHHAPVTTPAVPASQNVSASTSTNTLKGVLPPVVTGPTSDATANMPSGKAISVTPKTETPIVAPPPVVAPAVEAKVEPKIETPVAVLPKVEPPKIEVPAPVADTPKADAKLTMVAPKPVAKLKPTAVKPKQSVYVIKYAKKSNYGCGYKRDNNVVKSVCFNFNSDRLSTASKAKLNAIIPTLKEGKQFELNGFADAVGNKAYNNDLSERRNKAVLKYLQSKGIDADKVSVKSFGSEEAEKQKKGKNQRERRVDIRVLP